MNTIARIAEVRRNVLQRNDVVAQSLRQRFQDAGVLFIENVGNLVCPSSYDIGENLRLVLTSVTEGEDKPLKYPTIFNSSDVAVITKMDLAAAVDFDEAALRHNVESVCPKMTVLCVSSKTGSGIDGYLRFLHQRRAGSHNRELPDESAASFGPEVSPI